jgi:hypothetical protein
LALSFVASRNAPLFTGLVAGSVQVDGGLGVTGSAHRTGARLWAMHGVIEATDLIARATAVAGFVGLAVCYVVYVKESVASRSRNLFLVRALRANALAL